MKVEIRCPKCDRGYLVDELAGEILCPSCSEPIPAPQPATAVAGTEGGDPPGPAPSGATAADPLPAGAEVVCPRCNLHFAPRGAAPPRPRSERPRVLIVEDMRYFQEIAREALSEEYEVISASNAAEGLAHIAEGAIDLIVLDLTLDGEEGGMSLLRALTEKPCPILIFTAQDESEMYGDAWDELRKLGADDMVLKGMNVGESLARKVGSLLGKPWDEES